MHLVPKVDYETNFYYWIQAMCGWDIYHAEEKQYEYYKLNVRLSQPQWVNLQDIAKILKSANRPRRVLAELYGNNIVTNEALRIKRLSHGLRDVFDKVWKAEFDTLLESAKKVETFNSLPLGASLGKIVSFFDSSFNLNKQTVVYLIINPPFAGAIGHTVRHNDFILLHAAGKHLDNAASLTLSTVLHEFVHLIEFDSSVSNGLFKNAYEKYLLPTRLKAPKGYTWKTMYGETIVSCFANNITGGYFRPDTFRKSRPTVKEMREGYLRLMRSGSFTPSHLIAWAALNILQDVEFYLQNHKKIDSDLSEKLSKLFLEIIVDIK